LTSWSFLPSFARPDHAHGDEIIVELSTQKFGSISWVKPTFTFTSFDLFSDMSRT
jgi:hypothetical protein